MTSFWGRQTDRIDGHLTITPKFSWNSGARRSARAARNLHHAACQKTTFFFPDCTVGSGLTGSCFIRRLADSARGLGRLRVPTADRELPRANAQRAHPAPKVNVFNYCNYIAKHFTCQMSKQSHWVCSSPFEKGSASLRHGVLSYAGLSTVTITVQRSQSVIVPGSPPERGKKPNAKQCVIIESRAEVFRQNGQVAR